MTNGWIDIKNTDMMLIMGGNPAENHPCGFKWAMEAKRNRNAKIISVDPRFTRTSSTADLFLQIRAGSDIAFLGGMIRYAIENNRIAKEYLVNYTNAAFVVQEGFKLRRTGSTRDLIQRRVPTISPRGIIRRSWPPAARCAPPQRLAARHLNPRMASQKDQHRHSLFLPMSPTT